MAHRLFLPQIDMAAGVLKDCAAYSFVQNFATTEFPDPGCSKRDIVLSKAVCAHAATATLRTVLLTPRRPSFDRTSR